MCRVKRSLGDLICRVRFAHSQGDEEEDEELLNTGFVVNLEQQQFIMK